MAFASRSIKDQLITIIQGITYEGEPAFTEVRGHPRGEFDSYPSVSILPGEQLSTKWEQGANNRNPMYIVRTQLKATNEGTEFDYMYDLTDLIIDTLDTADYNGEISLDALGVHALILNTTRADWFEADSQAGPLLMCDINVGVEYSKDN